MEDQKLETTFGSGPTSTWFPLVSGEEPPTFITDGEGRLITIGYTA